MENISDERTILEIINAQFDAVLLIGDVRSFLAKKALELALSSMLSIVKSIQEQGVRIDEVRKSLSAIKEQPFLNALDHLKLASKYSEKNLFKDQNEELKGALRYFREAAHLYKDDERGMHALYLAGVCCHLLDNQVGKEHFYDASLQLLDKLFDEKVAITQEKRKSAVASLQATSAAVTVFNPINLILACSGPIGWGIAFGRSLPGFLGHTAGAMIHSTTEKTNYHQDWAVKYISNEKIKGVEFTWLELRSALATAR